MACRLAATGLLAIRPSAMCRRKRVTVWLVNEQKYTWQVSARPRGIGHSRQVNAGCGGACPCAYVLCVDKGVHARVGLFYSLAVAAVSVELPAAHIVQGRHQ